MYRADRGPYICLYNLFQDIIKKNFALMNVEKNIEKNIENQLQLNTIDMELIKEESLALFVDMI